MFTRQRALLALGLACWAPMLLAQSAYPTRPIHLIVPLAAGSAVDNAMRIVAERMSENIGQGIVIENQPGAAGLIGTERVAKAAADGYTIGGFNDSIMTMLPNLYAKLPWNIVKDFEPVSLMATIEWGLVTTSDSPYRTAADLIAAAKANPGKINYGSGGNGSPQHVPWSFSPPRPASRSPTFPTRARHRRRWVWPRGKYRSRSRGWPPWPRSPGAGSSGSSA